MIWHDISLASLLTLSLHTAADYQQLVKKGLKVKESSVKISVDELPKIAS